MIVFSNGTGAKVIPYIAHDQVDEHNKRAIVADMAVLAPGYNDIEDELWAKVRENAKREIENGNIVEEWVKPEKSKDGKEAVLSTEIGGVQMVPAILDDIKRPRVLEVIKGTLHIPSLKKWLEIELRQDVRLEIMKQLGLVNKNGE